MVKEEKEKKTLKKKLDTEWSIRVRKRDKMCKKCKKTKATQAAHIFSRNNLQTRWELKNGLGMCYYCHIFWAHREPTEFGLWAKETIGEKDFNELLKKSRQLKPVGLKDLQQEWIKLNS